MAEKTKTKRAVQQNIKTQNQREIMVVVGKENKKNSAISYKNIQNTKSDGEIMSHS